MALKGDLASVELAQVFQMLALNQKVGLLNIEGPVENRALYFDQRGVTLWYSEQALLEEVLSQQVCAGKIPTGLFDVLKAQAGGSMETASKMLRSAKAMTEEQLSEACRQEIEEEIYALFFWKDAHFEFHEGSKSLPDRDGRINERYFFSPDSLIMEAARRMDEWAFIQERVSGPDEVFLPLPDGPDPKSLDEEIEAILGQVDGKRNVGRIVEVAGRPAFHVHKALAFLLDKGFVAPIHPEELPLQAEECLAEGRLEEAIQLLEKAISEGVTPAACHSAAANAYDKLGERAASCYHQKCFAEKLIEEGRTRDGVEMLARVRELLPTDLAVRERLVELLGVPRSVPLPGFDPMTEGKLLVDLLVEMGETDRARDVIERLLVGRASDLELKKTLVGVHSRAGDTKRVLELYESIANDLVLRHDLIEAVKYLQKILLFDRSRKDVSDRIRQLYVLDERKRSRRRGLTVVMIGLACLGALGGSYYLYESYIRALYDTLPVSVERLIAKKDYVAAQAVYEDFMGTYSFSLVARRARGEIARIEGLKSQHQEELARHRIQFEADLIRIRTEYREVWSRYKDLERREYDPDVAVTMLDRVDELVKGTVGNEDKAWAAEVKLGEIRANLHQHLAAAAVLAGKAKRFLAEGRPAAAYIAVTDLHERYALTAVAKATAMPILVESRPNGALVFVDGQQLMVPGNEHEQAVTPVVLEITHAQKKRVVLELAGHTTQETIVTEKSPFPLMIAMPVTASVSFDVNQQLMGPFSLDQGIAVLTSRSEILAVEVPSGTLRFSTKLHGLAEMATKPVISANRITFATTDSMIVSLSTRNGIEAWSRKLRGGGRRVTEKDGYLYACEEDGKVFCVGTEGGRELWSATITATVTMAPAVQGKAVFLVTSDNRLLILRSDDGVLQSELKLEGQPSHPPIPAGDCVLVLLEGGKLICLDPRAQRTRWVRSLQPGYRNAILCLSDRSLLIATGDGKIASRALADGHEEALSDLGGTPEGDVVATAGSVYVLLRSPDRKKPLLRAMNRIDLSFRWEYEFDSEPTGRLTLWSGVVYVVTESGKVLGFE